MAATSRLGTATDCSAACFELGLEGEEMSDAETGAYLLMVGGIFWVLVGIVGLWRSGTSAADDPPHQRPDEIIADE